MPLFHVQDHDRPAYVWAITYANAVEKWQSAVAKETESDDWGLPDGVALIADDDELILDYEFVE